MKIKEKGLVNNILLLVGGTALAQLILFLTIPIITRIFGPENYGLFGFYKAITNIFVPIAALTYPVAIVLPKSKIEAKRIVTLSVYTTISISLLILITLILFYKNIINLFELEELGILIFLLPLATLFGGLIQVIEQWSIRNNQFKKIANVTVLEAIITNTITIFLGLFIPSGGVLISLESLKAALKSFLMTFRSISLKSVQKVLILNKYKLLYTSKNYKDFPLFRAPEVLMNGIGNSIPIIMLTAWFGPTIAGFYTLSRNVLSVPTKLIGKSIGDVLYPYLSKAFNNGENITAMLIKSTIYLALLGIIPFGLIFFYGPPIFEIAFGEEWKGAGEIAKWISLWSYCLFINIPSVKTLPIISAQAFHLKFSTLMLVVRTLSMIGAYLLFENNIVVIQTLSISSALLNIVLILSTISITKRFVINK